MSLWAHVGTGRWLLPPPFAELAFDQCDGVLAPVFWSDGEGRTWISLSLEFERVTFMYPAPALAWVLQETALVSFLVASGAYLPMWDDSFYYPLKGFCALAMCTSMLEGHRQGSGPDSKASRFSPSGRESRLPLAWVRVKFAAPTKLWLSA